MDGLLTVAEAAGYTRLSTRQCSPGLMKNIKINDHYMDAMRYGIFTANQQGIILS
ncbi:MULTISPECIES: hypothetical protein [unclassified Oceanispirochaeta]|uniref:hypothetical protein n=1 Tax=unclassified Oceanispirochaeta TaxID=2635722 RepID=UPI001314A22C|nr:MULTISPECIES: hypothetical protein [unclassified Oceanispirochaeta]MBF9017256.1 hypothetical protein [Oceanispirochaeta sp. M2]NPD73705.1 hypothetical protein [Oceanispirochaeta sp. M1]